MQFSLVICTYQRPQSLLRLLESVELQVLFPDQVIIVDGSLDDGTERMIHSNKIRNLKYFRVEAQDRGLTRQRNYGVRKVKKGMEVVFFLDDDTVLNPNYFAEIIKTYQTNQKAIGVSGYIVNEVTWKKVEWDNPPNQNEFCFDGWSRIEGSRFSLRRKFGLAPTAPPGYMPDFSHGYSTGFLPPSGKTYKVELLMGGIASYRTAIFEKIQFSPYFDGYGLYEDADFSLRASKLGFLYVNTKAKVEHHHALEGRPDLFHYGKMILRNGWYVWRVKNPKPDFMAKIKWNATALLLTAVRATNILNKEDGKQALRESVGRFYGWFSLIFNQPK